MTAALPITLTSGQQEAFDAFVRFLLDPYDDTFVLAGYSGTGKTTLVRTLLEKLPSIERTIKLIDDTFNGWDVVLTATTNKAAEAFRSIVKAEVRTIHSVLGLVVSHDVVKGTSTLTLKGGGGSPQHGRLIFIDEASYIDPPLLKHIRNLTRGCKIVFMGDPAQLTPIGSSAVPVFTSHFKGAHLTEVVRQAEGNPIIELSTAFREVVNGSPWFQFEPDGKAIQWFDRATFYDAMKQEFNDPTWTHRRSKFLAWTNRCVIKHNHLVRAWVKGEPELQVDDYAVCNRFLKCSGYNFKTDQLVHITSKTSGNSLGCSGWYYDLDGIAECFVPDTLASREAVKARLMQAGDYHALQVIEDTWADLRAAYACTINKAQGSTYQKVFIDLDDIGTCRNANQIARMLYVAVSRASEQVILTGDLV